MVIPIWIYDWKVLFRDDTYLILAAECHRRKEILPLLGGVDAVAVVPEKLAVSLLALVQCHNKPEGIATTIGWGQ